MKPLLIYGAGDFGSIVRMLAVENHYRIASFIDDNRSKQGGEVASYEEALKKYPPASYTVAIAIGYDNLEKRWSAYEKVRCAGYETPTLVHPRAYVASQVKIGEGSIIMATAVVDYKAEIGRLVVIWPGATINHDSRIGNNCFLSPNCTICGFADILSNCFIGAGAIVVDKVQISKGRFIKAGSLAK